MHRQVKKVLFASPWWHNELMVGVSRQAAVHGWHLDLQTVVSARLPARWRGDGIITTWGSQPEPLLRFLEHANCPGVSLSLNCPELPLPRVAIDNGALGQLAGQHFLDRGFTRIVSYATVLSESERARVEGLRAFLEPKGIEVLSLVWEQERGDAEDSWENRERWLRDQLLRLQRPLAVISSDQHGVEVIEAALSVGLDVPGDVAVLGTLDMPIFRESSTVPLSSIQVDFAEHTRVACELLEHMMNGGDAPESPILFPPVAIAVRRSTDTIAAQEPTVAKAVRSMLEDFADPISMPGLARRVGLSDAAFYAAFRRDLGIPPGAVLARIRVDKAKQLLRETDDKNHLIAETCGFGNRVTLHRQFERHVGMSPGAYRKARRPTTET